MSKRENIKELLEEGYSIPDIMSEMEVSRSYVSTVKGEIKKGKTNSKDAIKSEDNNLDGDNQYNSCGSGSKISGDQGSLEPKGKESKPDKPSGLGGVKETEPEPEKTDENEPEDKEGIKEWILKLKKSWKLILSGLTGLILLAIMFLFTLKTTPKQDQSIRPSQLNVRSLGR